MDSQIPPSDSKVAAKATAAAAAATSKDDANSSSECEGSDAETPCPRKPAQQMPSGLILKTGRVRLPDKLMEYLNKEVAPGALYWMPEGESFAFDTDKAQEQILDKFFSGTKLSSFLRSISRWGFKRVFYHTLEKNVYAFHHPLFNKNSPHLEKDMKMIVATPSKSNKAKKESKKTAPQQISRNELPSTAIAFASSAASSQAGQASQGGPPTHINSILTHSTEQMTQAMLQHLAAPGGQPQTAATEQLPLVQCLLQLMATQGAVGLAPLLTNLPPAATNQQQPLLLQPVRALQLQGANGTDRSSPSSLQLMQLAIAQQQLQQQQAVLDFLNSLQR